MTLPSDYARALDHARTLADRYLASLPERPVTPATPQAAPALPEGIGLEAAFAFLRTQAEPHLSASPGPRYLGFVTGGTTPEALAADWLASAWDQNVSNGIGSIAADWEAQTVRAYADLFGLGADFHGQFVSGATAANLVAMATARHWAQREAADLPRVFAGSAHSSILKAMAITGIGRARLVPVATQPGRTAVDLAAMAQALAAHEGPQVVVASAGEVNTGDFDDIDALADLCRDTGAWLHVDAAFGLFARLLPSHRDRLRGVERADSVTVDLHKWLNVPYDSALAYTRRPDLQRQIFSASAAYLGDDPDPLHYTPENSRRFRALPAWMVLAVRGRAGIAEWVAANCAQAVALSEGLRVLGLDVLNDVHLNIVSFAPPNADAAARDALLARINASGDVFMTPTVLHGRPAIRAAFSNWSTRATDVTRILAAVRRALPPEATP